jgi:tetratricopeptide (TPR) repeat protein
MLGTDRMHRGDFKGAEGYYREALAYVRKHGPGEERYLQQMLTSDLATNIAYQRPGDPEAIALMREAIDAGGGNPALSAVVQHNLAIQLVRVGRIEEAEREVREGLQRMDGLKSPPPERASLLRTRAVLLLQLERNEEAERLAGQAVAEAARTRPPDHPMQPNYKAWWGRALVAVGQPERGAALLQEAYDGYRRIRPEGHMELAMPLVGLGAAYRRQGKLAEAERSLRRAEAILRQHPSQRDRTADMAGELGLTLRAMGRVEEAQRYLDESHTILHDAYGEAHPLTRQALARKNPPSAGSM